MDKQQLLSLITNQLLFLGFDSAAQKLAKDANILNATPLNRLSEMLEGESFAIVPSNVTDYNNNLILSDSSSPSPDLVTWFTTTHKETVRIAVFNPDGLYLATASKDCSIKVLDVEKIRECYLQKNDVKPVVKTIYDHTGPLAFHPNGAVIASCSDDGFIKLFDLLKATSKKSFRYFQDAFAVKSIAFHPSGDFLLAATTHSSPRIYDIHSLLCYIPKSKSELSHTKGLTCVRYSFDGSMFCTASFDETFKIWDSVTAKIIKSVDAHKYGVVSIRFSQNNKFILSSGKLWDLDGNCLATYKGVSPRCNLEFSANEDHVFGGDEHSHAMCSWDTRSGFLLKRYSAHQGNVVYCGVSKSGEGIVSCSEDARARVWMSV